MTNAIANIGVFRCFTLLTAGLEPEASCWESKTFDFDMPLKRCFGLLIHPGSLTVRSFSRLILNRRVIMTDVFSLRLRGVAEPPEPELPLELLIVADEQANGPCSLASPLEDKGLAGRLLLGICDGGSRTVGGMICILMLGSKWKPGAPNMLVSKASESFFGSRPGFPMTGLESLSRGP